MASRGLVAYRLDDNDPLDPALEYYGANTVEQAVCCAVENRDLPLRSHPKQAGETGSKLSPRAQEVAYLLAAGATPAETARLIGVSAWKFEDICQGICDSLGADTMPEALRRMYDMGHKTLTGRSVRAVRLLLPSAGTVKLTEDQATALDEFSLGRTRDNYFEKYGRSADSLLAGAGSALKARTTAAAIYLAAVTNNLKIVADPAAFSPQLTPYELDALCLVAQGESDAAIAKRLEVNERTLRNTHLPLAMAKLKARNRPHAVRRLILFGFLQTKSYWYS